MSELAPILLTQVVTQDRREWKERRTNGAVPEALQRSKQRREEERRTSPRVPQRLWVYDPGEGGLPQVFEGEIGLGGASWWTRFAPIAGEVEVCFRIPHYPGECRATARVERENSQGDDTKVQVTFTDVDVEDELALARYLQLRMA